MIGYFGGPALGLITLVLLVAGSLPAFASPYYVHKEDRARYEIVSVASDGSQGNGPSGLLSCTNPPGDASPYGWDGPSISDDGRYVAFTSAASNLVPEDGNGTLTDVFVRDRLRGTTELVSATPQGTTIGLPVTAGCRDWSWNGAISGNGRFVAFASKAPLLPGLEALSPSTSLNVYVRDLKKDRTKLVSAGPDGKPAAGRSGQFDIGISENGRFIAFISDAEDLVPGSCVEPPATPQSRPAGQPCSYQAYVRDMRLGKTHLASTGPEGVPADRPVEELGISDDGSAVVFSTRATNLLALPDTDDGCQYLERGCADVFTFDVVKKKVEQISLNRDGNNNMLQGDLGGLDTHRQGQVISQDGRYVVFAASGVDMTPQTDPIFASLYLRDRKTGRIERISVDSVGSQSSGIDASISDDGRSLSYLLTGCPSAAFDDCITSGYVLHDRRTGQVDLVRGSPDSTSRSGQMGTLSGNGRSIVFSSDGGGWTPGDGNGVSDVYVLDLVEPEGGSVLSAERRSSDAVPATSSTLQGVPDPYRVIDGTLIPRPQLGDVLAKIEVEKLPVGPAGPAFPVVYGLGFETGAGRFEFRATWGAGPSLELWRCRGRTNPCRKITDLRGGYGTTGESIVGSIPTHLLGAASDRTAPLNPVFFEEWGGVPRLVSGTAV